MNTKTLILLLQMNVWCELNVARVFVYLCLFLPLPQYQHCTVLLGC